MFRFLRTLVLALLPAVLPTPAIAQVSVDFNPSGGTFSSANLSVSVDFCSQEYPILTWQVTFNGQDVSWQFSYVGEVPGCPGGERYTATLELLSGVNVVSADAWDLADNWGQGAAYYTYSQNQRIEYGDKFRDVSRCIADCFAATASYSTPAFVSLDAARAVTLVYRSDRAKSIGLVEIDATDASPGSVQKYSLRLRRPDLSYVTFLGLQPSEAFFTAGPGWTRLAVQFDASALATGAYDYTAIVRTYYFGGSSVETTIPARVMIVNGASSPFGAGWEIADYQRATVQSDGVMIASGDGSVSFFGGCSGTCQLTSPAGDLSTLNREANGTYTRRYPDGSKYFFSASGLGTNVQDRFGYGRSFGHDGNGRVFSVGDPTGHTISIGYDGSGRLSSITTPASGGTARTSTFTVDASGDLTLARDPDNVVNFTASYSAHRLTTLTDRRGGQWSHTYATDGGLDSLKAPSITVNSQSVRPLTLFSGPSRAILGDANPVAYGQDLRASIRNPRNHTTYFAVNRWGSPKQIDYPLGPDATAQYNSSGQVTQTVSPSGHTINYTWNGVQLTQVQDVTTGRTISATYESTFNRPLTISGSTVSQTFSYPDLKTISVTTGSHPATVIKLDAYGRDSLITDGGSHQTRYYFRTTGLRNADSVMTAARRTRFRRDSYGRVVATVNPIGHRDSVTYDILNRVIASTNGLSQTTSYAYGDAVFLTSVTDPASQVYSFVRNALGWVEQEYRPGSAIPLRASYDSNGNVVSTTNRRNQTITFTYDALDRLTLRAAPEGNTTFSYLSPTPSAEGYIAAWNAESRDTLFISAADRLVRSKTILGGNWYQLSYGYHSFGMVSSIGATSNRWGGTKTQSFGFTSTGALSSLNGTTLNPGTSNEDLATQIAHPGGLTQWRTFGSLHANQNTSYNVSTANTVFGHALSFDSLGRVDTLTRNFDDAQVFQYDAAGRLQRLERWSTGGSSCTPDPHFGQNCTWANPQLSSQTNYIYDAAHNLLNGVTQLDIPGNRIRAAGGYTFNYDTAGNNTSKVGPGFTQSLIWNALGQLTSATTNGITTTYWYDAFGRRVRKTVNGVATRFLHEGDNLHMELNASGDPVTEYSHWGLDQPHSMIKGGQTYFFAREPMGGGVNGLVRSSDNAVVSTFEYTPFGEIYNGGDVVGNKLKFAGREYDSETGLYYNRARYYDPLIGRFISEDPIGIEGGINQYAYAANDPVNGRDPSGLKACPADALANGWETVVINGKQECMKKDSGEAIIVTAQANWFFGAVFSFYQNYRTVVGGMHYDNPVQLGVPSFIGGPGGAGRALRLTSGQARDLARYLGFTKRVNDPPFNSMGQAVFTDGKSLITQDITMHLGPNATWKVYDRFGNRLGTYDALLNTLLGR